MNTQDQVLDFVRKFWVLSGVIFVVATFTMAPDAFAQSRTPAEFRRTLIDPVAAFARENSKTRPDYFAFGGTIPFPYTSFYAQLLKKCVFAWDPTEVGAPRLDPARPFGRRDLMAQLATPLAKATSVPGPSSPQQLKLQARSYVQVMFALGALLEHGVLAPGIYTPKNVSSLALREQLRQLDGALVPLADLNLNEQGGFAFTERHRTLLKHMALDWSDETTATELLDDDLFPGPRFDPKRPYGNRTDYPLEMATVLKDHAVLQQQDGNLFMAEIPRQEYTNLHRQTLVAMQVFVENAELKPGSYRWAK